MDYFPERRTWWLPSLIFILIVVAIVFLVAGHGKKEGYVIRRRPWWRWRRRWWRRPYWVEGYAINELTSQEPFGGEIAQWNQIGIAYVVGSKNPDNVTVERLPISSTTDEYIYRIMNRFGQILPFTPSRNLQNGDVFEVDGIGQLIFNACVDMPQKPQPLYTGLDTMNPTKRCQFHGPGTFVKGPLFVGIGDPPAPQLV